MFCHTCFPVLPPKDLCLVSDTTILNIDYFFFFFLKLIKHTLEDGWNTLEGPDCSGAAGLLCVSLTVV